MALCKLCIFNFLIPLRCVFEVYHLLKKLCRSSIRTVIKNMKIILIFSYANYASVFLFLFEIYVLWNFEQAFGILRNILGHFGFIEHHCGENKVVKFVLWLFKWQLLSFVLFLIDAIYANYQETPHIEGSKNTTVIFYILEGYILGYASCI